MPELLTDGLPERRRRRSRFDFSSWADGQAWKFTKGDDYESTTDTFRSSVRRWAKEHGFQVELRPYPAVDADGRELPLAHTDGIALGVQFIANGNGSRPSSSSRG